MALLVLTVIFHRYAIATSESKPGERHLYRVGDANSSLPWQCLTCPQHLEDSVTFPSSEFSTAETNSLYASETYFQPINSSLSEKLRDNTSQPMKLSLPNVALDDNNTNIEICLYNRIMFSPDFRYYIQECLGPTPPFVNLYETATNSKIMVLDSGSSIRSKLNQLAQPQFRTFEVEIEDGYNAQIKLLLPPGMRENEDIMFPLILLT